MDRRSYGYDVKSNITSTVVNGNARSYSYDALDRLTSESYQPSDSSTSYGYDLNHNRQTRTEQPGPRESYAYEEGSNRLRQMDRAGQSLPAEPNTSYEYNDAGKRRPTQTGKLKDNQSDTNPNDPDKPPYCPPDDCPQERVVVVEDAIIVGGTVVFAGYMAWKVVKVCACTFFLTPAGGVV